MSTLGVSSHPTTRLRTISSRRYRRGAGALVAVLLLAAVAGTGLAVHYAAQHAARQTAQAFEAGRVFAAWVLSAHRASQELDYSVRLAVEPAFVLTPATLRGVGAVPPGLPARAGREASFVVGIMDDGRGGPGGSPVPGRSPVAMAFGVLEPARPEAAPALRRGAIAGGLAALADAGSTDTAMAAHVPAIEGRWVGRSRRTRSTSRRTPACATKTRPSTGAPSPAVPASTGWRPRSTPAATT